MCDCSCRGGGEDEKDKCTKWWSRRTGRHIFHHIWKHVVTCFQFQFFFIFRYFCNWFDFSYSFKATLVFAHFFIIKVRAVSFLSPVEFTVIVKQYVTVNPFFAPTRQRRCCSFSVSLFETNATQVMQNGHVVSTQAFCCVSTDLSAELKCSR